MKRSWIIISMIVFATAIIAQDNAAETKQVAKELFYHEKYKDALNILSNSRELSREDKEGRFLIAVCHYQLNQLNEAYNLLVSMVDEDKTPYPESWFYLGKIYQARHQFHDAAREFKLYLRAIKSDHPNRQMAREEIRRCANGIDIQFNPALAVVENMGYQVNTTYDEFAPVLSPNYSDRIYFSSVRPDNLGGPRNKNGAPDERLGEARSDIFSCQVMNGIWSGVKPMHYLINSPRHEVLLDFNPDGSALYYFKGWTLNSGEILVDTFRQEGERRLNTDPFSGPLDPSIGDGNIFVVNDNLIYFASRRPGGYGGSDLYRVVRIGGKWGYPQNLGPAINTPFDETSPFVALDELTLYFSSNDSRKSIGGLDIFKSVYVPDRGKWIQAQNLGMPINSAGDDSFFRIARDGFTAYFASSRKDGIGKRDLYIAYFNDFLPEMEPPAHHYNRPSIQQYPSATTGLSSNATDNVLTIEESPTKVEKPVEVVQPEEVPARAPAKTAPLFSPFYFNSDSDLTAGTNQGMLDKIAEILVQNPQLNLIISTYTTNDNQVSLQLYHAIKKAEKAVAYLQQKGVSSNALFLRGFLANQQRASFSGENKGEYLLEYSFMGPIGQGDSKPLPIIGKNFQPTIPDLTVNKALCYKIQIGSALNEYKKDFRNLPNPMIEKLAGFKYYRYTLGAFSTYSEAQQFQKKLRKEGFSGAFVVPYINGYRIENANVHQYTPLFPDLRNYLQ